MPSTRAIQLHTELAEDTFLFKSMRAQSRLGRLHAFELELLSETDVERLEDLLGTRMTVELTLNDGSSSHFDGLVTSCRYAGSERHFIRYEVTLHPWLWLLTRTRDWRIFQNQTALDIVATIFGKYGANDFEDRTTQECPQREYCVQYGETDFDFVSRLLEAEGICYYFVHRNGGHKLVLADSVASHDAIAGLETIPYLPADEPGREDRFHLKQWSASLQITSGAYVTSAYDFTKPKADLQAKLAQAKPHAEADHEIYEFPGPYDEKSQGRREAQLRLEELQAPHNRAEAAGVAPGLTAGALFTLEGHPRADQNVEFLVIEATHEVAALEHRSEAPGEDPGDEEICLVSLSAIPSEQPFRPDRSTPLPDVRGPETAMVVGRSGEEIWTDEYARIKVQFHWDRLGASDENSSCWLRVSQLWAGPGFGGIHIPRIGQEVLVDFLHGDPDRPYVAGRFYNAEAMPPFELPAAGVISGIKSNTHKGQGYNEMTLDDTTDNEKITIHGQYDMNTTVEHDQTNTVKNDFTETITNNAKIEISDGTLNHDVKSGTATYHVKGALTENYDATQTTTVKGNITIKSTGGAITVSADAQHIYVHAATSIELHTGASKLTMASDGKISLEGVTVTINGSKELTTKGGIVHSEAQSQHQTKGAIVLSEGSASNTVKGGVVMLNP